MKIITTVGTSLFANYAKNGTPIGQDLENRVYWSFDGKDSPSIEKIRKELEKFVERKGAQASAELKTIANLQHKHKDQYIEVYLIATDTMRSVIAAQVLKSWLEANEIPARFRNDKNHIVPDLNVFTNDRDIIEKGYKNLIEVLINNTTGYGEIYNISGGYKALIPLMTQIASFKKVNLAYIYENSDYLIEIPPFPFEIDYELGEQLYEVFEIINRECCIKEERLRRLIEHIPYEKRKEVEYFFEYIEDDEVTLSKVGMIVYEDLKSNKEVKLRECEKAPHEKNINPGNHHGKEKVERFGKKLVNSPYVCEIINSSAYKTHNEDFICAVEPQGQTGVLDLEVPDTIYGILVKTTGRNQRETKKIAEILKQQFAKG